MDKTPSVSSFDDFLKLWTKSDTFKQEAFNNYIYGRNERERHRLKSRRQYHRKKEADAKLPPKVPKKPGRPRKITPVEETQNGEGGISS